MKKIVLGVIFILIINLVYATSFAEPKHISTPRVFISSEGSVDDYLIEEYIIIANIFNDTSTIKFSASVRYLGNNKRKIKLWLAGVPGTYPQYKIIADKKIKENLDEQDKSLEYTLKPQEVINISTEYSDSYVIFEIGRNAIFESRIDVSKSIPIEKCKISIKIVDIFNEEIHNNLQRYDPKVKYIGNPKVTTQEGIINYEVLTTKNCPQISFSKLSMEGISESEKSFFEIILEWISRLFR